jgi:ubiquinone biosynthesis protein
MIRPSQALRLWYIRRVMLRHGLDELIQVTHLYRPLSVLISAKLWYSRAPVRRRRGERIRSALEELGPIFVKFGQLLSTRRDLLPGDIAEELAKLQDKVPPFPGREARTIVENAYRCPLEAVFATFEETPFASASIAQVHGARLKDGREVVVKVLRPAVERIIRRDVELLYTVAGLAERYWKESRRFHPRAVVAEYEKTILDELDLVREAANASQLRRNFEGSRLLYIPSVEWPLCRRNVMVMERIYGTPVSEVATLKAQAIDLQILSENGVEIFFTQVFRDNFFHGDMHPGNIFVASDGRYISVDFGIMGTLSPSDQRYLAENLLAFFHRDYRRVAELHVESGWVPPRTRVDEFESAIRTVCEPIFERPLREISFGLFLVHLFQTARRFDMEVQPQLVLLQKTLLNIEGLGRQLYPDLDLWKTAKPFLERSMREQVGPQAFVRRLRKNLPVWSERLPEVPILTHQTLERAVAGRLELQIRANQIEELRREIRRASRRGVLGTSGAALVVSASLLLTVTSEAAGGALLDVQVLATTLGGLGAGLLLAAWLGGGD